MLRYETHVCSRVQVDRVCLPVRLRLCPCFCLIARIQHSFVMESDRHVVNQGRPPAAGPPSEALSGL
jgi:hypothetical protein